MTDLQLLQAVQKALSNFMQKMNCHFINNHSMVFYPVNTGIKDQVGFSARNRRKSKQNTEYELKVGYSRRFENIENIWQDYYDYNSESAKHSITTIYIRTDSPNSCLDLPGYFIINKNDPEVISKCKDYIIRTYEAIKKKIEELSSFIMLDALYNGKIPCLESYGESGLLTPERVLFRRIIIAYYNGNPNLGPIYWENREVLIRSKERFQKQKERYEKALHVYDDIYRRIQAGEIEKAQTLI